MRTTISALVAASVLLWFPPTEAEAASSSKNRSVRAKTAKAGPARTARRPASVGQDGLCQRDTGTPESQLDFRNACDVEEYWRRIMDRSPSGEF